MNRSVGPDTLIAIKANYEGTNRRFKLPLKDLEAYTFPRKIREVLSLSVDSNIVIERYSDSAARWVTLNSSDTAIYKQLYRAAKAKTKLRIKITESKQKPECVSEPELQPAHANESTISSTVHSARGSYLNTVLNDPLPITDSDHGASFKERNHTPATKAAEDIEKPTREPEDAWKTDREGRLHFNNRTNVAATFYIDCNHCGNSIPNAHWHCSICEDGDYDLCQRCIDSGLLCPGEDHWLIKRSVIDGLVVNSTTETIAPKSQEQVTKEFAEEVEEPGLATVEEEAELEAPDAPEPEPTVEMRTCNSCFQDFEEAQLVTCFDCHDYDLCFSCIINDVHGHHPGHSFFFTHDVGTSSVKDTVGHLCDPGRGVRHMALCDGCDKRIRGVRHKCLDCPDFDFCGECVHAAPATHPGHRFVPLYEPIPAAIDSYEVHHGVYCDGPLCQGKGDNLYITGDRYKCAICHDTDFCSRCEAHPDNTHNRTHPLLKFKTAVRHVSISTMGENDRGQPLQRMGDRPNTKTSFTEPMAVGVSHAATQVQKTSDLPAPRPPSPPLPTLKGEKVSSPGDLASSGQLQAQFMRDTYPDGFELPRDTVFTKTWTLQNSGAAPWPQGCSVRFAGGDTMFNIDSDHPTSTSELISAMESNKITKPVAPGDSADFRLTLKTPLREGRAISYWRLKTPDGAPFGDRLWCDVAVVSGSKYITIEESDKPENGSGTESAHCEDATGFEDKAEEPLAASDMVFPKLERESPEMSISDTKTTSSATCWDGREDEHDLADDVESLTMDDADTDGFLTDEEYDILDASDQEFPVGTQKHEQK
ncbi:ZZ type Zinc finger containing protein [Coccidioides posadasii C735 delta SOWgp]|uniref:ZZ type Zinc finger containing protein n=1 Tax=Coccidioides posadasii (strain C735) TaxID=222929 RepID=C5PET8_COCP7|nr:ZZ type Zinc finger containing protein [Coccidioides posadasii C735 delta SOWgp]EER23156.1 ZZ type Zinc finger containing protein [Coccidioides posadasii C735 delta SOWgp]|eukprot:XP_003065301.1 ZZ type Zinc finger containing protein [Coccidioides posadasii C735 delta SOWgp]